MRWVRWNRPIVRWEESKAEHRQRHGDFRGVSIGWAVSDVWQSCVFGRGGARVDFDGREETGLSYEVTRGLAPRGADGRPHLQL